MFSSRSYQRCFIHLFAVILYFFQLTPSLQDSCLPSISTVRNVSHCPTSKQEWDEAAKNKKCQDSVKQNCTSPAQFKYHCLIRSDGTVLVEVCAPEWKLNGYCPLFKVQDGSIINNFDRDCSNYTEIKCPSQYNSTEVYKFPKCYTLLPSSTLPLTTLPTTSPTTSIKSSQTSDFLNLNSTPKKIENQTEQHSVNLLTIFVVLLSCALVIMVVVFVLCTRCKEKIKCNNSPIREEEVPLQDNPKREEQGPHPDNPKGEEQGPHPDNPKQEKQVPRPDNDARGRLLYGYPLDNDSNNECTGEDASNAPSQDTGEFPNIDEKFITASIDIGTTHTKSGFALFVNKSNQIPYSGITTDIEESVILFDNKKEFMAFGKKAVELYLESDDPNTLCFIRNFSMRRNLPTNQDMQMWRVADHRGCGHVFLLDVYAETIKFVKDKVEKMANESFPGVQTFHWVLTYPATWKPVAKDFLYQAALKAGISKNKLGLEMEHCSAFEWHQACESREQTEKSKCLFVDVGGGSTKICANNAKQEAIVETKEDSGGITLIKAFEKCLEELFDRQVLEAYKLREREDYFKLFSSFIKKINEQKLDHPASIHFDVSKMVNVYKIVKDEDVPHSLQKSGMCLQGGKLEISHNKLKSFFEQCQSQIKSCIKESLNNLPESNAEVYLFGGFLNSDIIFQYVMKEFQSNSSLRMHKIRDPEIAIVKGAVIHGGRIKWEK